MQVLPGLGLPAPPGFAGDPPGFALGLAGLGELEGFAPGFAGGLDPGLAAGLAPGFAPGLAGGLVPGFAAPGLAVPGFDAGFGEPVRDAACEKEASQRLGAKHT